MRLFAFLCVRIYFILLLWTSFLSLQQVVPALFNSPFIDFVSEYLLVFDVLLCDFCQFQVAVDFVETLVHDENNNNVKIKMFIVDKFLY